MKTPEIKNRIAAAAESNKDFYKGGSWVGAGYKIYFKMDGDDGIEIISFDIYESSDNVAGEPPRLYASVNFYVAEEGRESGIVFELEKVVNIFGEKYISRSNPLTSLCLMEFSVDELEAFFRNADMKEYFQAYRDADIDIKQHAIMTKDRYLKIGKYLREGSNQCLVTNEPPNGSIKEKAESQDQSQARF